MFITFTSKIGDDVGHLRPTLSLDCLKNALKRTNTCVSHATRLCGSRVSESGDLGHDLLEVVEPVF